MINDVTLMINTVLIKGNLLETDFDVGEGRPLGGFVGPALTHQVVHGGGTVQGEGQPLPVLYLTNHIIVFDSLEWFNAIH